MKVDLGENGAIMEVNVGQGFETTVASGDSDGGLQCQLFAGLFTQPAEQTAALLDTMDLDLALYTVYRPAKLEKGKKYPLLTWGNGTCAQPEGYGTLLRYVASQGYFVVAANSRWVGGNSAMTKALDFMFAANEDSSSPYYKLIDTEKVGAFGHSQGAMATIDASSDSRVKTAILFNGGTTEAAKPYLTVSGDRDIGNPTVDAFTTAVDAAAVPAAWLFYHMVPMTGSLDGHLTLMTQPERVIEPTVAWFDYQLLGDADAKKWFVGATAFVAVRSPASRTRCHAVHVMRGFLCPWNSDKPTPMTLSSPGFAMLHWRPPHPAVLGVVGCRHSREGGIQNIVIPAKAGIQNIVIPAKAGIQNIVIPAEAGTQRSKSRTSSGFPPPRE
jgi:hypothetical protein